MPNFSKLERHLEFLCEALGQPMGAQGSWTAVAP